MDQTLFERRDQILNRGIINWGNLSSLKDFFRKAEKKEDLTVAFIGGSITQGCVVSKPEKQYTRRVFSWFEKTFPETKFTYLNAPVGGTTSEFGVARVEKQVLSKNPDFLIIEFSVNDENTEFYLEMYEGLVRKVLSWEKVPAVLLVSNVRFDNGVSAQDMHAKVANAYGLPLVSMRESFYMELLNGSFTWEEITVDGLHPNDFGHEQLALLITNFLSRVSKDHEQLIPPITKNRFQNVSYLQNTNFTPVMDGFEADHESELSDWYYFADGWKAKKKGASITFKMECTSIAVQYRKSKTHPAPVAHAVIDGNMEEIYVLDGNFTEEWGDCLYLEILKMNLPKKEHEIRIWIEEADETSPIEFYLASIQAGQDE